MFWHYTLELEDNLSKIKQDYIPQAKIDFFFYETNYIDLNGMEYYIVKKR